MVGGAFSVTAINRVKVIDATLRDMRTKAVYATRRSEIDGVTITGSRTGAITSPKTVVIRNSTIFDNGGRPVPETGEVQYYSAIIFAGNIRVYDSVIVDNAWGGIKSDRAYVRGSTLTGNGAFPECGVTRNCKFDIGSLNRPSVSDSTCNVSLNRRSCAEALPEGVECNGDTPYTLDVSPKLYNWGVCQLD